MNRFFVPPHKIRGSTITIDDPQELHHIRDVLRLGGGDRLSCFDGEGSEYTGTITQNTRQRITVQIDRTTHKARHSFSVWLAQGLPKGDRFDWVIQKATELGVARLSPLLTRHTVVRLSLEQGRTKHQRWQRIAQEAAKQCGRTTVPVIDPPQPLESFLPVVGKSPFILMPTLAVTTIPLSEVLRPLPAVQDVIILIGPEGDFSREEVALAEAHGARPVSLGPLTLRSETAAIATLAIVHYALSA